MNVDDLSDNLENDVKSLVDQLKEDQKIVKEHVKSEEFKLDKDNRKHTWPWAIYGTSR